MGDAWAAIEEPYLEPNRRIFGGQFRMALVSAGHFSYLTACTINGSDGAAQGPVFGFSLCVVLGW